MTRKWIFLISLSLTVACASTKKERDEAVLHAQLGASYFTQKQFTLALRELTAAEQLDPKNAMIQNDLALVYFVKEKYVEAESHLLKALDLNPKYSEARNNLGRLHIEMGKFDLAIREIQEVLKDLTFTQADRAYMNLTIAYFRKGQFEKARQNASEALSVNRSNCLAHNYFGRSLLELGKYDEATTALDKAVLLCSASKYDEPHYFSALAYYKMGARQKAVARMEEVLKMYPQGQYAQKAKSMLKIMK